MHCIKRAGLVLLAAVLLAAMTAGCSDAPEMPSAPEKEATTLTDQAGRTITLAEPVTRLVALTPSDCEIVYALGAGDLVVGRGSYCDFPAEVLEVPEVQSGANLNAEQVIALEPQVVLTSTMDQSEEQIQALQSAGIEVVITDANQIDEVYESIALVGAVVDRQAQAGELVDAMQRSFAALQKKAGGKEGETVYFEVSPLEHGLWAAGSGTFMDELAGMLGLTNAFADVEGWGEVSQEQVLERDPDYIVTISMFFGDGPTPEEEILGRESWQQLQAIRNGRVFHVDNDAIARPGPRLVEAAEELYALLYQTDIEKLSA